MNANWTRISPGDDLIRGPLSGCEFGRNSFTFRKVAATVSMPTTCSPSLIRLCRSRLKRALDRSPHLPLPCPFEQAANELAQVVSQNLPERLEHYNSRQKRGNELGLAKYVERVVEQWLIEAPRVHLLESRDETAWLALREDLRRVAAGRLAHSSHLHSTAQVAEDFANRACMRLLESRYPFDIPFDAWARTILKHLIWEPDRSADLLDHPHLSLDEELPNREEGGMYDGQADNRALVGFQAIQDREMLLAFIKQLRSKRQQALVFMQYFQGLPDEEIARRLGTSRSNVQTLRSRALGRLSYLIRKATTERKPSGKHQNK